MNSEYKTPPPPPIQTLRYDYHIVAEHPANVVECYFSVIVNYSKCPVQKIKMVAC